MQANQFTAVQLAQLRRLPQRISKWALEIHCAAALYHLDPLVIAAILERESKGGDALMPPGPRGKGDGGHGHGLMQLDDRWHKPFIATGLWAEAAPAMVYAARLLRQGLDAFGGDYPETIGSYNAGIGGVRRALADLPADASLEKRVAAIDKATTDAYVAGVLWLREVFETAIV